MKISKNLYEIAERKRIPLDIVWELTSDCNLECRHCYLRKVDGRGKKVDGKRVKEVLKELKAPRKIAVLGSMNELGNTTKVAHLELGAQAAQTSDVLIAVGPEATTIKQGAISADMPENHIHTFFDSEEGGHWLKNKLKPKDLILVKGSQNRVRLERLVKIIMKNPEKAGDLLCRQDKGWDKI